MSPTLKILDSFRYKSLSSSDRSLDEETGSKTESDVGLISGSQKRFSSLREGYLAKNIWWTLNIVVFLFSGLLFVTGLKWHTAMDSKCFEQVANFYSPAFGQVDETYQLVQYNGTVGWPSPYAPKRGEQPNPDIDEAWNGLNARPMSVSEEVVLKSGENTSAVRVPPELGGGYLAWAEVNHQLHCVNLLRKALHPYWDYYANITADFQREPEQVQVHLDHCVEMLRQVLMCNADTGVQLHWWVKGNPTPIPNSNTWHKCKNFDNILQWTKDNQIPSWGKYLPILPGSHIYEHQP